MSLSIVEVAAWQMTCCAAVLECGTSTLLLDVDCQLDSLLSGLKHVTLLCCIDCMAWRLFNYFLEDGA